MPNQPDGSDRDASHVVVTLAAGCGKANVCRLLGQGFALFCVRADRDDSDGCRRIIDVLRVSQAELGLEAAVVLQLDGQHFPNSQVVDLVPMYLHPSSLPQEIKQQILLAQIAEVEFVCLSCAKNSDSILTLKSCLAACGASAKVLVRVEANCAIQHVTSLLGAADGALISAEDFSSGDDADATEASQKAIVKLCRRIGLPVFVCLQST